LSWLYGFHAVAAALNNPRRQPRRLVGTEEALAELRTAATPHQGWPAMERAERHALDRLLPPEAVHQGLALLVEPLEPLRVEEISGDARKEGGRTEILVVLDQVTDPHNVGAILRSAAAFGASGLVMTDRHAPDEGGALAKAASGALERVPIARTANLAQGLDHLKEAGFWTVGLAAEGERTLAEAGLSGRIALVLGSEGRGLRRLTRERCDLVARLPTAGDFAQLNVSVAAAIALYELRRKG
jgi:23S rRNA (guanosine2251-2'-O)-methyltransferase